MGFGFNMDKAKDIHKDNIRFAREEKLKALDIEFQKALETSSDASTIIAKKQALRDAPAAAGISTAANPQDFSVQAHITND